MKTLSTEPWRGPSKVILAIDVGTTHSAVSFSYLFEGGPQTVQHVNEWPGQGTHRGYSKIPTLVYYDQASKPVCYGAEALKLENRDQAEDNGWRLAKHFKLHLHPQSMSAQRKLKLYPLPFGVPLATIYTDFLSYLLQHTRSYFEDRVIDGHAMWAKCSPNMLIVLTHPNGWATREQHFLKQALQNVGPPYKSCQVAFVTEGEASVHFCMAHSSIGSSLQPGNDLVVCDAGGSTIDITAYQVERTAPSLEMKEKKASACIQMGGVFVDMECERYLKNLLSKAGIAENDVEEYVAAGVEDFEATAKKDFVSPDTAHYISFHDSGLKQPELGIRRGRMSLKGEILCSFFEQAVSSIIQTLREQMQELTPKFLLLVGGFGESLYLRRRLSKEFTRDECQVTVIEDPTSKAAADGAVIWAIKLAVIGRVTRFAYGTTAAWPYDPSNPEHQGRKVRKVANGEKIDGYWSEIVGKSVFLNAEESVRHRYFKVRPPGASFSEFKKFSVELWVFCGDSSAAPVWVCNKHEVINPGFQKLCKVEADLRSMEGLWTREQGPDGPYYRLNYTIAIQFGGTELRARIEWVENGTVRSGPISIIPEPIDLPPGSKNMA